MSLPFHLLAGGLGIATHMFYFHKGEHHLYPQRYLQTCLLLYIMVAVLIQNFQEDCSTRLAMQEAAKLVGACVFGIYFSLIIFRVFLNPMNKFPGPPLARLTAFDFTFRVGKNKDMYQQLYHLHQKLGKFVRTGPNNLSVTDADVVRAALGAQSTCSKAPWYSAEHPAYSMHSTRSRVEHDKRRRIWSPAFSDKALRGYEKRVLKYNELLTEQIQSFSGQPIDMSKWFNLWSFDVMGDLAFGKSFNMLESATEHWAIQLLNKSQDGAALALPEWFTRLLLAIPGVRGDYLRFLKFCASQIEDRMLVQGKQADPDITHFLIEDFNAKDQETQNKELKMLHVDSKLIIVAGSDTTAATLTYLFYHIAVEPGLISRLREELEPLLGSDGAVEHQNIQGAALLNGCINETLRLHPPVPSGVYRKAPQEGIYIGEQWIPGNTILQVHFYAMSRDEDNFAQAGQFIPERFFSRPELIKNRDAFVPFLTGPYGCIGKNLAYMEIRTLTAKLISKFDVTIAPGEDGTNVLNSSDHFTIGLKPFYLVFTPRGRSVR